MMIAQFTPPIARDLLSGDSEIERMFSVCLTIPICQWVDVSEKVIERLVEHAINLPCVGIAMHESKSLLGTDHSETVEPVDASSCLIVLSDTTKMWLLNHRRP